jgi:hypothetical protein
MPTIPDTAAQIVAQTEAQVEERLAKAEKYYLDGHVLSIAAAARDHDVSKSLLWARLKGRGPLSSRLVNWKRLDDDLEGGLLLYVKKMATLAFLYSPKLSKQMPTEFLLETIAIPPLSLNRWERNGHHASLSGTQNSAFGLRRR